MRAERLKRQVLLVCFLCALGGACGGDDDGAPMCIELPADCVPGFNPNWDGVFQFAIQPSCGGSFGTNCHGPEGRKGNLVLHEKDAAFRALLGMDGTHARVEPNDPACSPLMERLATDDAKRRMPLNGAKLSDPTICSVQKWIEQGAKQ